MAALGSDCHNDGLWANLMSGTDRLSMTTPGNEWKLWTGGIIYPQVCCEHGDISFISWVLSNDGTPFDSFGYAMKVTRVWYMGGFLLSEITYCKCPSPYYWRPLAIGELPYWSPYRQEGIETWPRVESWIECIYTWHQLLAISYIGYHRESCKRGIVQLE